MGIERVVFISAVCMYRILFNLRIIDSYGYFSSLWWKTKFSFAIPQSARRVEHYGIGMKMMNLETLSLLSLDPKFCCMAIASSGKCGPYVTSTSWFLLSSWDQMYWSCSIVQIVLRFIHRVELGFNYHTKSGIVSHGKGFSMATPFLAYIWYGGGWWASAFVVASVGFWQRRMEILIVQTYMLLLSDFQTPLFLVTALLCYFILLFCVPIFEVTFMSVFSYTWKGNTVNTHYKMTNRGVRL